MRTHETKKWVSTFLALLAFMTACSPSNSPVFTSTPNPPTATQTQTLKPSPIPATPTATSAQPVCLTKPGRVKSGTVTSTEPAQEYSIYLPPCYDEQTEERYPVLYLLHGQTYNADQWIRLGAVNVVNRLIISGKAQPFIIVFLHDRYWYTESGSGFGDRLVNALIPYIDETYRTLPDRNHRAIGGMSRGAGWALRLGLSRWDLFSIIGLHSLAVFQGDGSRIERWLKDIPPESYPVIYMDIGDNDQEHHQAQQVEALLGTYGLLHEWHLYSGAHTEEYWIAHIEEYMKWYASQWNKP
jgi:enterochelin esterase-like enzyme